MVEQVLKIGMHLFVDLRQMQVEKLVRQILHCSQDPFQLKKLAPHSEQPCGFGAVEEGVDRVILHRQNLFFQRVEYGDIAVDEEVENGVKHIVRSLV